jgi:predicted ribosome quality control (RQC) complex YloA/Tae2 family protein
MSTYHSIYGRLGDKFFKIRTISASFIYTPASSVPFEGLERITDATLRWCKEKLEADIKFYEKQITDANQRIEYLLKMEGSLEERLETINEIMELIDEAKEEVLRRRSELEFTEFLWTMLKSNDEDEFRLYQGFEISNPTIDDIVRDN